MASFQALEQLAISFPEVTVEPHFEKLSFRVKKKIFVTFDSTNNRATVKLSEIDQATFSSASPCIQPVDNKWGKQGWTFVDVDEIPMEILHDVITTAYCTVAPAKLAQAVRPNTDE